jgi:hypothetical protein
MNRATPELKDVHHSRLWYGKDTFCGHPRQGGIFNYGSGRDKNHASNH